MTLTKYLNDLAGTDGLQAQGAANALAGTNGLALCGAVNRAAGTSGLELQGALDRLGGVPGVAPDGALSEMAFIKRSAPALWLDARFPYGFNGTPNLLTANQASVETDTTGFENTTNCALSRSTAQAAHGAASLQAAAAANGTVNFGPGIEATVTSLAPVVAGVTYTAVAQVRSSQAGRNAQAYIRWMNSSGAGLSNSYGSGTAIAANTWELRSVTATAPAGAAYAAVRVSFFAGPLAGETYFADCFGLWQGSSTVWRPPGGYADGAALPVWADLSGNGRHASQTTPASQPLYRSASPNLLTYNQATAETDTTGLTNKTNCTIARGTTNAAHGTASLDVTSSASGEVVASTSTGTSGVAVSPSTQYTAVVSARSAVITSNAKCRIFWWTSGGSAASTASSDGTAAALATGSYTQYAVTATSPADAAYATVGLVWTAVGGSEVVRADKLGLWEGSSTTWVPPVALPGGMPVVQFDGVSRLESDAVATVFSGNDPTYTVYAVAVRDAAVPNHMSITGAGTVASTTRNTNLRFDTVTGMEYAATDDAAVSQIVTGGTACSIAAAKVMSFAVGANIDQYLNGTSDAASTAVTTGTFTYDSFGVGAIRYNAAWVNYLHGGISALLVYSGAHDTATRQRIERALGRIYGVTVA